MNGLDLLHNQRIRLRIPAQLTLGPIVSHSTIVPGDKNASSVVVPQGLVFLDFYKYLQDCVEVPYFFHACEPGMQEVLHYRPSLSVLVEMAECFCQSRPLRLAPDLISESTIPWPGSPAAHEMAQQLQSRAEQAARQPDTCFMLFWYEPCGGFVKLTASEHIDRETALLGLSCFLRSQIPENLGLRGHFSSSDHVFGEKCWSCEADDPEEEEE